MEWHTLAKEEVLKKLNSSLEGLSQKEAEIRLERYGKNVIEEVYKISPFKIFLKQFKSFLIYILLFAIVFSVLIKHFIDASVIFAIVILNASLGFVQQYKAEKSIINLRKLLKPEVRVFRNGRLRQISSEYLVPGDLIRLAEGDKITADCRLTSIENLEVNEAILTGESAPVEKCLEPLKDNTILAERANMLFSGTSIVKGNCRAVVVETGMTTEFGKIATMLQEINLPETPMQKKLDKFAKQVSLIVISLAILTFIIGVSTGKESIEMFLTSIAVAVSVIPEGLPAIITINLAFAINTLSKKNVIIRRLPAAETLGSVTLIATDKTGTITEEKMSVREIFCNNNYYAKDGNTLKQGKKKASIGKELSFLFKTSVLCNNARFEIEENEKSGYITLGDPTETALLISALDLGFNKKLLTETNPRIQELPFTSERKMMSILRKSERREILYVKGASESILKNSSSEFLNGTTEKISDKRKSQLKKVSEHLEEKGYRVLAFAFKFQKSKKIAEEDLTFLGFMALLDPPRKEVKQAIEQCKKAGIKVKIITGDSPLTAKTVASEIGISGKIVTGQELDKMTDEVLEKEINNIVMFARVSPQDKLRIVEILKLKGEEVAITGDGVNDVLALKKADIGIAMGKKGSDVAREVSDMILTDDNFASIVKGVEEGRIVYDNSKKATKFLLASNFNEILIIAYSIIRGFNLPLLPLQILWINLVTDSMPALALTKEKGEKVMESKPRKEPSILTGIAWFVIVAGIISLLAEIAIFHYGLANFSIEKTRTMVMFLIIAFESFFVFTCRSNKSLFKIGLFSNKWVIYAVLGIIALQVMLIYTPLAPLFRVVPLSLGEWGLIILAASPTLIVFEAWKLLKK